MRPIKFKAWDILNRNMHEVYRINFSDRITVDSKLFENDTRFLTLENAILLQYTELKDKNGKTYCQDDWVKYKNNIYRLIRGSYGFGLIGFCESPRDNPTDFFAEGAYLEGEIVGNIHENPEYLEGNHERN
ncbi:YopX family protein [Desemzia sp. FAM 23990]|uniref:YopX family protein n=1 Tax=Desemzia sp. FAM 23990 TaxID=3259520 RepID=UPI00388993C9